MLPRIPRNMAFPSCVPTWEAMDRATCRTTTSVVDIRVEPPVRGTVEREDDRGGGESAVSEGCPHGPRGRVGLGSDGAARCCRRS